MREKSCVLCLGQMEKECDSPVQIGRLKSKWVCENCKCMLEGFKAKTYMVKYRKSAVAFNTLLGKTEMEDRTLYQYELLLTEILLRHDQRELPKNLVRLD
ncbi:MAG: hypothetical protein NC110_05340 [Ruminococcus sp.]|nr:hypothetical protein [Ruminococcus sp.]